MEDEIGGELHHLPFDVRTSKGINYENEDYMYTVCYDDTAWFFRGESVGNFDRLIFKTETSGGLEKAFQNAMDEYLRDCMAADVEHEMVYSSKLTLRVYPDTHR